MTLPAAPIEAVDSLPPPLKWAGGKRWLLPQLEPLYKKYQQRRLVEPFAGGLAVALGFQPRRALLSDLNPHVVNFYKQLKAGLIIERNLENEREFFFASRAQFNLLVRNGAVNSRDAAELFYYLNRTAFNGLCRFNSSGEFNVPFGKYTKINYRRDFSAYSTVFKDWTFLCADFAALEIRPDDFLYVDPPYDVEFTRYAKEDFSWADQERLAAWLATLTCPMVVSNQGTARILKLYRAAGFEVTTLVAPRRIACNGDRSPAVEMLAMRNL